MILKIKKEYDQNTKYLIFTCILTVFLIALRDIQGIGINKFIFVAISIPALFVLSKENVIAFLFFLIPLFNGLPGNYLRILILLVLIVKSKGKIVCTSAIFCVFLIWLLEFCHITSTGMLQEYIFWGINLFLFIYIATQEKTNLNPKKCILFFSVATAIAFLIMFIVTVKMNFLELILSGRFRFGDFTDFAPDYAKAMHLTIDPNFLGYFCLASIMAVYVLVDTKQIKQIYGVLLIVLNSFWGILSLSRTFILLAAVFVVFVLYGNTKNIKRFLISTLAVVLVCVGIYILVSKFYPEIFVSLERRLNAEDMAGGNGRSELMDLYLKEFWNNIAFMIRGTGCIEMIKNTGIYNNLHSTPVEILVGFGFIGASIFGGMVVSVIHYIKTRVLNRKKFGYYTKVIF